MRVGGAGVAVGNAVSVTVGVDATVSSVELDTGGLDAAVVDTANGVAVGTKAWEVGILNVST